MVCIPTCYTEVSIEVRALNVTMPGAAMGIFALVMHTKKHPPNGGCFNFPRLKYPPYEQDWPGLNFNDFTAFYSTIKFQ